MYGPIAPNPAWRLVNLLKTIRSDDGKILIDGFYDDVAKPTSEEPKVTEEERIFGEKAEKSNPDRLPLFREKRCGDGYETSVLAHGQHSRVWLWIFRARLEDHRPEGGVCQDGFRLVANMRADDILAKLRRHMKKHGFEDVKLTVHSKEDPAKTPWTATLRRL